MFFCRARSRQSTTRRISASCFFLPVAFFGTRKIYLLSTDCMWDFLSPVDFTQSFLPLAGVRLQFMSSYIKMVTAGAGLVQLCVYWSRFKDWSLRPLVEGHMCEQRHCTFHDPCENLLYTNKLSLNKHTKQSNLKIMSDWFPHLRFQYSMYVFPMEVG